MMWLVTKSPEKQTLVKLEEGLRKDVSLVVVLGGGSHLRIVTLTAEGEIRIDSMSSRDALRLEREGFKICHAPLIGRDEMRVEAFVGDEQNGSRLIAYDEPGGVLAAETTHHETVEIEAESPS